VVHALRDRAMSFHAACERYLLRCSKFEQGQADLIASGGRAERAEV